MRFRVKLVVAALFVRCALTNWVAKQCVAFEFWVEFAGLERVRYSRVLIVFGRGALIERYWKRVLVGAVAIAAWGALSAAAFLSFLDLFIYVSDVSYILGPLAASALPVFIHLIAAARIASSESSVRKFAVTVGLAQGGLWLVTAVIAALVTWSLLPELACDGQLCGAAILLYMPLYMLLPLGTGCFVGVLGIISTLVGSFTLMPRRQTEA